MTVASRRVFLGVGLCVLAMVAGGAKAVIQDTCGPFTDVTPGFCPFVLELYYLGITVGTSATTFSPDDPLTRGQAAVFVAKAFDQSLARSSRRAALGQWWATTPHWDIGLGVTTFGGQVVRVASDGSDLWVTSPDAGAVYRVRASDGRLLETWTGATLAYGVLCVMGRVFVTGNTNPSALYMIDPTQAPGNVTVLASNLGYQPTAIAFDGSRIWTANYGDGSVSIITPSANPPWSVTTVTVPHLPTSALFDGSNVWITSEGPIFDQPGSLAKLDSNGSILQSITVGTLPRNAVFDGTHIWVPNSMDATVSVVRASTGVIDATLTGNSLSSPLFAAFDGSRISSRMVPGVVATCLSGRRPTSRS